MQTAKHARFFELLGPCPMKCSLLIEMTGQSKHRARALECHRARIRNSITVSLGVDLFDAGSIAFYDSITRWYRQPSVDRDEVSDLGD